MAVKQGEEGGEGVKITNHVIRIPHAQFPHFLTQVTHLLAPSGESSLLVWCGSVPSTQAQQLLPDPASQDDNADPELAAALAAAGRSADTTQPIAPGSLALEFAVAMAPRSKHHAAVGSSLFSTPSDIALPMSRRIATKLGISQLFLSLDLPHPLLPTPGRPQRSEDSSALLALERAIRHVCASVLPSS